MMGKRIVGIYDVPVLGEIRLIRWRKETFGDTYWVETCGYNGGPSDNAYGTSDSRDVTLKKAQQELLNELENEKKGLGAKLDTVNDILKVVNDSDSWVERYTYKGKTLEEKE